MLVLIIVCGVIMLLISKYKIWGVSFMILGLLIIYIVNINNLPFIPREVLIKYDTIVPIIRNDLNDNETLYSYYDDKYCYYYIESSKQIKSKLIFDEVKIPSDKVKIKLDDNDYPIAKIIYSDFTPIWKFVIGRSKPIVIECIINK